MAQRVYCNVAKHRILDNNREVEDVTKIGLPTVKHPTSEIKSAGMVMDVNMPDVTHLEAMELTIHHNNGVNCKYLSEPGKHFIEVRTARQRYDVAKGDIGHESVKYRFTCAYVTTEKGDIETGSPYGSTEKYSILRYEEEVDGSVTTLIDATSGILKSNGKDCVNAVDNLLK